MPETFLPMRAWFERDIEPLVPAAGVHDVPDVEAQPLPDDRVADDIDAATSDARRFRAALGDAIAMCVDDVLRDIAADVLARELLLAPCDLRAIVASAVERYGDLPVRIRVHPSDACEVERGDASVVCDDTLRRGDAVLEMRHGGIDASLGVRLERVLRRFSS